VSAAIPAISDAEWEVMNVLWSAAPDSLSANQVIERIANRKGWNPRTVKTLLNRLIKKHALAFERDGKSYLYRPAVRREQCVRAESRSFLARVFGGDVAPMLAHFVTHADLSPEELDQLQRLLQAKRAAAADIDTQKAHRTDRSPN
jgi:BlaI family transcriptional regulator, penicillinase repressor